MSLDGAGSRAGQASGRVSPPGRPELELERFLVHLRTERRLSPHTVGGYGRDLAHLLRWARRHGLDTWQGVGTPHIRRYAADLHRDGRGPRTIHRRLAAARSLYAWLVREGLAAANPATGVQAPRGPRHLPRALEIEAVARLIETAEEGARGAREGCRREEAARDRAILELLYSSGLRLSELQGLDWADLDLGEGLVRVRGKGGKVRIVPVGRMARDAIRAWLPLGAAWLAGPAENKGGSEGASAAGSASPPPADGGGARGQPLFVTRTGRRLSRRSIQARIRFWARLAGLGGRVHPHQLRHSFASHVLESSGDLRAVQELLGHAHLRSTQIYTRLDLQHLASVYDASHPRARRRRR